MEDIISAITACFREATDAFARVVNDNNEVRTDRGWQLAPESMDLEILFISLETRVKNLLADIVDISDNSLINSNLRVLRHHHCRESYEEIMVKKVADSCAANKIRLQREVPVRVTRDGSVARTSGRVDVLVYVTDKIALILEFKAVPLSRLIISRVCAEELMNNESFGKKNYSFDEMTGMGSEDNVYLQRNKASNNWSIRELPEIIRKAAQQAGHYAKDFVKGAKFDVYDQEGHLMYQQGCPLEKVYYAPIVFFGTCVYAGDLLCATK